MGVEKPAKVALFYPEIGQTIEVGPIGQRGSEQRTVQASRGGAGDYIDHDRPKLFVELVVAVFTVNELEQFNGNSALINRQGDSSRKCDRNSVFRLCRGGLRGGRGHRRRIGS